MSRKTGRQNQKRLTSIYIFLDGIIMFMNKTILLIKTQAAATATSAARILGLLYEPAMA
jgi:hypothetical protein